MGLRTIAANAASSKKCTLSSVRHMWFTMMSACASSSSFVTRVTDRSANATSSTYGSYAITFFTRLTPSRPCTCQSCRSPRCQHLIFEARPLRRGGVIPLGARRFPSGRT